MDTAVRIITFRLSEDLSMVTGAFRWLSATTLSLLLWFLMNLLAAEWHMGQGDNGDGMAWRVIGLLSSLVLGCLVGISFLIWPEVKRLIKTGLTHHSSGTPNGAP